MILLCGQPGKSRRWVQRCGPIFTGLVFCVVFVGYVSAGPSWRENFDTLCGYTNKADNLSIDRLNELVGECDRLLEELEKSKSADKKIYIFRLHKCRNFFKYMAEVKETQGKKNHLEEAPSEQVVGQ